MSVSVSIRRLEAMRSSFPPFRLRPSLRRASRTVRSRRSLCSSRTAAQRRASPASRPGRARHARTGACHPTRETSGEIEPIHLCPGRYARTPHRPHRLGDLRASDPARSDAARGSSSESRSASPRLALRGSNACKRASAHHRACADRCGSEIARPASRRGVAGLDKLSKPLARQRLFR